MKRTSPRSLSCFRFAIDRPLAFEARVKFSEAAVDAANVLVGVMDAVGANALLDDGGGPKASYSGAVFYKGDGESVWSVETSLGASQTTTPTNLPSGGGDWQTLSFIAQPTGPSEVEVVFRADQGGGGNAAVCRDASGRPFTHTIKLGTSAEMSVVLGVKAGDDAAETLLVDYVACTQAR